MVAWLEHADPALYQDLTRDIPGDIDRIFDAGGPLHRFEEALERLLDVHREACRRFEHAPSKEHSALKGLQSRTITSALSRRSEVDKRRQQRFKGDIKP
jgi:predicted nucleotidyltransferase